MFIINNEVKAIIYATLSGLFYGMIGYLGVSITRADYSIANMLFWRFLVASIVIALIILISKEKQQFNSRNLLKSFSYGAIFYSFSSYLYFLASQYIGTGLSMVIFFIYPMIIILFNWLNGKQKIGNVYYISIALILTGMLCLINKNELIFDLYGIILALLAAVSYAAYIIYSKNQAEPLSALLSTLVISAGSGLFFLIISLLENSFKMPVTLSIWLDILAMGIICTALPILFLLEALKYISSAKAAILSVLEPVAVVILGVLLLDEKLSFIQLVGVITIVIGALVVQFDKFINTS